MASSRAADSASPTRQAMALHDSLKRNGAFVATANALEGLFREIQIFEVVQMFEDGFARVVGLGAARAAGQAVQTLFDGVWKPNREHCGFLLRYTSIA